MIKSIQLATIQACTALGKTKFEQMVVILYFSQIMKKDDNNNKFPTFIFTSVIFYNWGRGQSQHVEKNAAGDEIYIPSEV